MTNPQWAFEEWLIYPFQNRMVKANTEIAVKPRLMRVWHFLMLHQQEIVRKENLIEAVWPGQVVTDNLVAKSISELRQMLQEYFGMQIRIETIRGIGYRLKADHPLHLQQHPIKTSTAGANPNFSVNASLREKLYLLLIGILSIGWLSCIIDPPKESIVQDEIVINKRIVFDEGAHWRVPYQLELPRAVKD